MTGEEYGIMTYRTDHMDDTTLVYAASYGAADRDAQATVIGFSPSAVDSAVGLQVRNSQQYAAEQCWITEADGTEREAELEDFPYWTTDAMEIPIGDIVSGHSRQWDDAMRSLRMYGVATIAR